MTVELLSKLRYKSEGVDIDFKSAQYRFTNGSEEDKSELLKDVLALANAWRDGPGYILLGFKESRPHPAEVVGIVDNIDDAKLQQFVHGKVKPKLTFRYEEVLYEGKTVGVFTIPKQARAFYLAKPYGKLKSNVVYVRRGSSTDEAEPPEIAQMAKADAGHEEMRVDLSVLSPDNTELSTTFSLRFLEIIEEFPDFQSPRKNLGPFGLGPGLDLARDNSDFWREFAEYIRVTQGQILLRFALMNRSGSQLSNAKLEVAVESSCGRASQMFAESDIPSKPKTQWTPHYAMGGLPGMLARQNPMLSVDGSGQSPICNVRFGSLLPGEEGRAKELLAILPLGPGELRLKFRILASELSAPLEIERVVEATGPVERLDFESFKTFLLERYRPTPTSP